jgi:hypothetical protein
MKTIRILSVFLLLVISSGCAQKLPSYKEGYGMVAVPYYIINRSGFRFLYTFEWISSKDDNFSVKIQQGTYNKDVALSGLIPSGNYLIDTVIIRVVSESNVMSTRKKIEQKIEPTFNLNVSAGSISMVPVVYEFEQYLGSQTILIKSNVHDLADDEEEFFIDRIKKRENVNQWKVKIYGK